MASNYVKKWNKMHFDNQQSLYPLTLAHAGGGGGGGGQYAIDVLITDILLITYTDNTVLTTPHS